MEAFCTLVASLLTLAIFADDPWLSRVCGRIAPLQLRLVAFMLHSREYSNPKSSKIAAEGFNDILVGYFNEISEYER